jgi:hypothetical protein
MKSLKMTVFCMLIILVLSIASCNRKPRRSTASENDTEDFNVTEFSSLSSRFPVIATEEGLYYILKSFLYYADLKTQKTYPLCFKLGCRHEEEHNMLNCDACVGMNLSGDGNFLGQYKGKLYLCTVDHEEAEMRNQLVSMEMDGSAKKILIKNMNGIDSGTMLFHRGFLYYITNAQKENGVGLVDMGSATTGVAIYDEGELQFAGVVPIGSNDITNDLATVLKTIPEIAEEIKLRFASAKFGGSDKDIVIKRGRDEYRFERKEVDEVVEARLEEIFEGVRKLLKHAGYDKRLPEGLVLVGGGSKLRDIEVYARDQVELAVRLGKPEGVLGVSEEIMKPEFAVAIGLMYADAEIQSSDSGRSLGDVLSGGKKSKSAKGGGGFFASLLKKFK